MTGPVGESGHIVSFDPDVGLGQVASVDGRTFPFHCTAIVDGSRRIDVGRAVVFTVGAAGPGCWEALRITPLG